MPTITANGIEMYYEQYGSGEPLVLIMGWGGNAATWRSQIPGLAQRFQLTVFDNRGVGRTSAPDAPFSTAEMAEDVAGLMDGLGIERAHVLGISLGGMVAQELAIATPERVGALVLGCTTPGGSRSAGVDRLRGDIAQFRETFADQGPDLEWFSDFLKRLWTDEALLRSESALQDFVLSIIRFPPAPHGLRRQAEAVHAHDTLDRLADIGAPTLVITGDEDGLIDPENSAILADAIPEAELCVFPRLRHAFHLERPDLVNPVIIDFIYRAGIKLDPSSA